MHLKILSLLLRSSHAGSRFKEINRAISRYVTETHEFPEFGEIKGLVGKANEKYQLNLRPNDIYDTAKEVFVVSV